MCLDLVRVVCITAFLAELGSGLEWQYARQVLAGCEELRLSSAEIVRSANLVTEVRTDKSRQIFDWMLCIAQMCGIERDQTANRWKRLKGR